MNMSNPFIIIIPLVIHILIRLSQQDAAPRVVTKSGPVVGTAREDDDGKMIYSFQGIPYIKPPVGDLRFKNPEPIDPWRDDFSATRETVTCLQQALGPIKGREDCVILNVFTPWDPSSSPPSKPLSVMVFIHGGGFIAGSSNPQSSGYPDYLLRHDVVLVMVNYRLGVLGFMSTEDQAASGNYGLLDQVEALKWVKDNIASFGGNPEDVTIFGESAGAASVHYLMLTPHTKGLFHRAIIQSGVSINPWASTRIAKLNAKALAKKVGCPEEPSEELVACLRTKEASELVGTQVEVREKRQVPLPAWTWAPRIDSEASEPFLPTHPIELMTAGEYNKVPLLIGHTRTEGLGFLMIGRGDELIPTNWDGYCKHYMSTTEFLLTDKLGTSFCKKLKERYINSSKDYEENKLAYADLIGDAMFNSGIYKSGELMAGHSPVYSYMFNYESEVKIMFNIIFKGLGKTAMEGTVCHGDDLLYLFKYPQLGWTTESPENEMVEKMSQIWTDFAKTGVPSISGWNKSWPQVQYYNHKYVVIDSEPSIDQNFRSDKMKLFNHIYKFSVFKTTFSEDDETWLNEKVQATQNKNDEL